MCCASACVRLANCSRVSFQGWRFCVILHCGRRANDKKQPSTELTTKLAGTGLEPGLVLPFHTIKRNVSKEMPTLEPAGTGLEPGVVLPFHTIKHNVSKEMPTLEPAWNPPATGSLSTKP